MTPPLTQDQFIISPALGTRHSFFTRKGGVSTGPYQSMNCGFGSADSQTHVRENRARAATALGVEPTCLLTLYQVHSAKTVTVTQVWSPEHAPKADAMVTRTPGLALGILTADCAPVLFADCKNRVIGAAHAGWKGALKGVIEATVEHMLLLGGEREHITAAIGPCISQKNYEVGPEFRTRFCDTDSGFAVYFVPSDSEATDHWRFNLPSFVSHRLTACGIAHGRDHPACTYDEKDRFYSYRRSTHGGEPDYGRTLSAIVLDAS